MCNCVRSLYNSAKHLLCLVYVTLYVNKKGEIIALFAVLVLFFLSHFNYIAIYTSFI